MEYSYGWVPTSFGTMMETCQTRKYYGDPLAMGKLGEHLSRCRGTAAKADLPSNCALPAAARQDNSTYHKVHVAGIRFGCAKSVLLNPRPVFHPPRPVQTMPVWLGNKV